MEIKIALAGNPNCGKTTLFNDLTGSSQYVGNWPGVTVEKKEGRLKGHSNVFIQDLPGIYSLSPYTLEETISREYLVKGKPDVILNIVDGTNIERNLYLTTQLIELGIPVVLAVNMIDLIRKNGDLIDISRLGEAMGCRAVKMSALRSEGSLAAAEAALEAAKHPAGLPLLNIFKGSTEQAIALIEKLISPKVNKQNLRWYAIKVFERDVRIMAELKLEDELKTKIEQRIKDCEKELDDDAESIIISQRYAYISSAAAIAVKKKSAGHSLSVSDRIDRIVTNRILALPIFASVMFAVYWTAMGPFGSFLTDWTNDVLGAQWLQAGSRLLLESWNCAEWLIGLVSDGVIAGVGAVLGFIPQMLVLFFMLALLEDFGYMARIAFIMDRFFRRFGLSGKSFIPMLIGSGCGVPGVMASRTIENERDRRMTVMTACFVPCGAKLPIIGLFAGALFGGSGLIATSAYFIGAGAIIISGIILKKTKAFAGDPAPFVMELPQYHLPSAKNIVHATWERGWSFIRRAGTVIVASSMILWLLQGFGIENGFRMVQDQDHSLLAMIGNAVCVIFVPLGFGDWQSAVATITGLIAKENVVSTFGVLFHIGEASETDTALWTAIATHYTALSAYSFMVFNLLCAPCFAAMGAIRREMNSTKWTLGAIGYMCGFAYITSLMIYQFGGLITGEAPFGFGTAAASAVLVFLLYMLFRNNRYHEEILTIRAAAAVSAE